MYKEPKETVKAGEIFGIGEFLLVCLNMENTALLLI
jgi:hypothetical protein